MSDMIAAIIATAAITTILVVTARLAFDTRNTRLRAVEPKNPSRPYAKIIADSITTTGFRLTTMEVRMHRFVLAEFNTHTVFERNSASSRAIPVKKQIQQVLEDPAIPLRFPSEQSGMQGGNNLSSDQLKYAREAWLISARRAATFAKLLSRFKVHKSITNRILEPYLWHTVVVTSSKWDNFFEQRVSPLAQEEIREPAALMKKAYTESTPIRVGGSSPHRAHLPYVDAVTYREIEEDNLFDPLQTTLVAAKVSSARCARVSHLTHDGVRDYTKDLDLYSRLVMANPKHWSPLAHVAIPCPANQHTTSFPALDFDARVVNVSVNDFPIVGKFPGWITMRHLTEAKWEENTFR